MININSLCSSIDQNIEKLNNIKDEKQKMTGILMMISIYGDLSDYEIAYPFDYEDGGHMSKCIDTYNRCRTYIIENDVSDYCGYFLSDLYDHVYRVGVKRG